MEEKKLKLFGEDVKLFGDDIEVIEEKFNFDYRARVQYRSTIC